MPTPFKGFDFSEFWKDSDYARKQYVEATLTKEMIATIESKLGFRIPRSYVALMKSQNGGLPRNTCFPTAEATSWAEDHIAITGIMGIGQEKTWSLCGGLGSKFMQDQWGYPDFGIYICTCPSAGHDMVMLDYRKCGPQGEPEVIHVDQECDFKTTFLAKDFETFIRGLVNESVYDTSADDLAKALKVIDAGSFSAALNKLLVKSGQSEWGGILRKLCRKLAVEKGYFALHADPLSHMVYDLLFLLSAKAKKVGDRAAYLKFYPSLIVFGDGEFSTGGYAEDFVVDWLEARVASDWIVKGTKGTLQPTSDLETDLVARLTEFH